MQGQQRKRARCAAPTPRTPEPCQDAVKALSWSHVTFGNFENLLDAKAYNIHYSPSVRIFNTSKSKTESVGCACAGCAAPSSLQLSPAQ